MQDRAISEIGNLELEKQIDLKPFQLYIEEITPGKVCTMALIVFSKTNGDILYKNIDIAKVNEDNYQKFGYRKGSARGGDITFTTKFGDLDKKLRILLNSQWPRQLEVAENVSIVEYQLFKEWKNAFEQSKNQIQSDLASFHSGLNIKDRQTSAFTLAIEIDNKQKFLADFESVQEQILLSGTEGKKKKYKVTSEGKNSVCSICLENKAYLYGFGSPFKYATVDKPGTVSGFFLQKNNWINYPICKTCALEFELGKNYVTKNLSRSFFGKRYYLIPKTVLPNDKQGLKSALNLFKKLAYKVSNDIERREDYLMERIGGLDNFFTLNMLFYEENPTTKAIKIKLMLEEIPPSRFRTLFIDIPKIINNHPLYKNADYHFKKKEKIDLKFSFGLIKQFFEDSFYDILYKVFTGQSINRTDLFHRFMLVIRNNYNKKMTTDNFVENMSLTILKAHLVLRYLEKLNIVFTPNMTLMIPETEEEKQELQKKIAFDINKLKDFLNKNKEFIYANHIAGIFSLGVLVSLVFSMQQASIGNTPFEKKLRGLNLSANDLQRIFIDSISKINQYSSIYTYKNLRDLTTENFAVNFDKIKNLPNQEISFYFVSGLELGRKFKSEKIASNL
ncbi:MAG: TIGR02556 family CRISPR-associated protein [Cytophagales bacterium]|nr:TIGR02556 family CRISPR-associated protein [Cytophagales bacterium]